jgi:hypothetical protein
MKEVARILQEYKSELSTFLKIFNYLKKNNIKLTYIKNTIDNKINSM